LGIRGVITIDVFAGRFVLAGLSGKLLSRLVA